MSPLYVLFHLIGLFTVYKIDIIYHHFPDDKTKTERGYEFAGIWT